MKKKLDFDKFKYKGNVEDYINIDLRERTGESLTDEEIVSLVRNKAIEEDCLEDLSDLNNVSPKKISLNEAQRSFTNLFSFLEQSSSFNEELLKNFNFIQNKIEEQKYFSKSQTKLDNFFSKI